MGTDENGTNIEDLIRVLNEFQGLYQYGKTSIDPEYHLVESIISALNKGVPTVADISTLNQYARGQWTYSMAGHYILISGMEVTEEKETPVPILDPYRVGKTRISIHLLY